MVGLSSKKHDILLLNASGPIDCGIDMYKILTEEHSKI